MKPLARLFSPVVQYLQGAYKEFRQVTWPSRAQITQYTFLVTVTIVVSVLVLTAFDYGLDQLTKRYLIR